MTCIMRGVYPQLGMRPDARSAILAATLCAMTACGDDSGVVDDAGVDGAPDAELFATPPDIPWLDDGAPPIAQPTLTPCPEGWREVIAGGVTACDPYAEGGAATCAAGEAHFPAEAGCRAVGDPCPASGFASGLPSSGVIYVDAAAAAGGDGTLARPYARLADVAFASLSAGETIALAQGSYEGTLPLKAGVRVIGACAAETVMTGVAAAVASVVSVTSSGDPASLENLTIADAPQRGVQVESGRALTIRGVVILRTREAGVSASGRGTTIVIEDSVIGETTPRQGDERFGVGLSVAEGSRIDATRLVLADNRTTGAIISQEGTVVTLTDSVVRDTQPQASDRTGGRGVAVQEGALLEATRTLFIGNHGSGVFVANPGSRATLLDVVVQDTQPDQSDGTAGTGVAVGREARLDATRLNIDGSHYVGLFIDGLGTEVAVADAVIHGTLPRDSDGIFGRGVSTQNGARLNIARLVVADNHDVGMASVGADTVTVLEDVVVEGTLPRASDDEGGRGMSAQEGARIEASRVLVTENHELGVTCDGESSQLVLTDVVVRQTHPRRSDDGGGRGISVQHGASLEASRVLIADNHDVGIFAIGASTTISMADIVVRDTEAQQRDGEHGRGLTVQDDARLDGDRVRLERSKELGVVASLGGVVELRDLVVTGVDVAACAATSCPESAFGYGAAALSGTVRLTRFDIGEAATCGVFVSALPPSVLPPSLDLSSGIVQSSQIGACIQFDGYDLDRLTDDVEYSSNVTNLDSTMLPVPRALDVTTP